MKEMRVLQETIKFNAKEKSAHLTGKERSEDRGHFEEEGSDLHDVHIFPTEIRKRGSIGSHEEVLDHRSTKPLDYLNSHKSVTMEIASPNDMLSNQNQKSNTKTRAVTLT